MTKEELEEKLKISKNTWIHCPTIKLAKQVLNMFNQLGLTWCDECHYTACTNWYSYAENTIYYPFEGKFSYLRYALPTGTIHKIINAEEFIALHTEGEEFDLQNYTPKGELEGFPKEIISRMLDYQEEQGRTRDISVFESRVAAGEYNKGFVWNETKEGYNFWHDVINSKDFNLFFEKYPKQEYQDNPQEFRVGDEVIYFITNKIGIVREVKTHKFDYDIDIVVDYGNNDICEYEIGADIIRPFLLHYRNDYDYSIIDFNNLPKRQEPKRWRTEKGGEYHYIRFYLGGWFSICATKDDNSSMDNMNYNSGNYFRTIVEAEIIAQKLNTYFKQLIQEEHIELK